MAKSVRNAKTPDIIDVGGSDNTLIESEDVQLAVSAGEAPVADGEASASGAGAEWLKRAK